MNKNNKYISPSKFATRLLRWFCHDDFYEELQGDLEEKFYANIETTGLRKANAIYRKEVIKMLRPSVIKKPKIVVKMFRTSLFQIHLKLAFRNLWRNKVFSAINIFGLAAAITVSMFALNILYTGFSVERHHPHKERTYRVLTRIASTNTGIPIIMASTSPPLGEKLLSNLPEIETLTQFSFRSEYPETINGNRVNLKVISGDEFFLDVFKFETILGDSKAALQDKAGVIITNDLAKRFFPNENPVGNILGSGLIVNAVIQSPKGLSHLDFDLISINTKSSNGLNSASEDYIKSWERYYESYIYFRTSAGINQEQLDTKLKSLSKEVNLLREDKKPAFEYRSQNIGKIIFGEDTVNTLGYNAPKELMYILIILITILLLLASFNYTNLSIAKAIQRTKEIGIRKVAGSTKSQIIGQIMVETTVFSVAATLVGFLFYKFLMPEFLALVDTGNFLFNPNTSALLLVVFLGFSVVVGLIAGLFPALYFARISPLSAFRSNIKSKTMSLMNVRKGLVVLQLTISMFCIIVAIGGVDVYSSIMQNNWNFQKEGVVTVEVASKNRQLLKTRFEQMPGVVGVSAISALPGVFTMGITYVKRENDIDSTMVNFSVVDSDFKKVFEPRLFAGNNFNRLSSDSTLTEVWVNKKLLTKMKIPLDSALGHTLSIRKSMPRYQIIGIMEDYLFDRLDEPEIKPTLVAHEGIDLYRRSLAIKIATTDLSNILTQLEKATKEVDAEQAFTPIFLNDSIEESYEGLNQLIIGFKFISIVIIAISLLGQLGIALYNAERRMKEIGIRKVLGARIKNIIIMLLKGTLITLVVSTLLGAPLAYMFLTGTFWQNTVVKTNYQGLILAQGVIMLGGLIVAIVIIQTWRVASLNPTESLRSE